MTFKPLFTVAETAVALGVSPATVRRLAKDFHLDQRYLGSKMTITRKSIEELVENLPCLPDPDFWD